MLVHACSKKWVKRESKKRDFEGGGRETKVAFMISYHIEKFPHLLLGHPPNGPIQAVLLSLLNLLDAMHLAISIGLIQI